jgi:hypothetical protein
MNNRQKLVQQQFLNDEEKVIKRLDQVYNQSLKDVKDKIQNLQFDIDKLQAEYDWFDTDDAEKAKIKSKIQSKIYQKQYQEQLHKQLDGIVNQIKVNQYVTVSDYLDGCYTDGFIGTIFDAHGQGVPIITPIDQQSMVRAVQLESKISKGLYTRLGEDVDLLKRKIVAQVSRGISTGMTYAQVAKGLTDYTRIGYNNAVRIARTEGHRVQTTAAMDAMNAAKDKGADVVKQWDATLDGRTRESHSQVDGEIRELDKPFSNGLDYPGDPSGGAAEVVNCRCAILQRAKWALDDDELDTLKQRAEYFGLDKSDQFNDFKKKYLKAVETPQSKVTFDSFKLSGIDADYIPDIEDTFNGLMNDYPVKGLNVKTNRAEGEFGHFQGGVKGVTRKGEQCAIVENEICISKTAYVNKATSTKEHTYNYKHRDSALQHASRCDLATIPHEYGHAIDCAYVLAKDSELKAFADKFITAQKISVGDISKINDFNRKLAKSNNRLSKEIFDELQKEYNLDYMGTIMRIDQEYGHYASSSISEFLAEGFANMRILPDEDKTDFMKSFERIFNRKFNEVFGE